MPLGFLGAASPTANTAPVLEDMASGLASFSRCIDSVKCEMPPYTFANVPTSRRDPRYYHDQR